MQELVYMHKITGQLVLETNIIFYGGTFGNFYFYVIEDGKDYLDINEGDFELLGEL